MWRSFLSGAVVILTAAGASSLAPGQATAANHGPNVLLVCNGSTAPCPAGTGPHYRTVQGAVAWSLPVPGDRQPGLRERVQPRRVLR
jgi:hypothetical protein